MTPEHRDVSLACAEQALLPAVRDADPDTVVLADGFSCRTQITPSATGTSRTTTDALTRAPNKPGGPV
jgi:hypothetical protein